MNLGPESLKAQGWPKGMWLITYLECTVSEFVDSQYV